MKFEKGDDEQWLWEFLHSNIYDYFNTEDIISYDTFFNRFILRKSQCLKKDIEIIIKIDGKIIDSNALGGDKK
jgi:hypothetical protein